MAKTLTNIEAMALAKAVDLRSVNDESALPPQSSVEVDFTARITGTLNRGKGSTRSGTNRARTVPVICLFLHEMGVTRDYAPNHIIELWANLGSLTKQEMDAKISSLTADEQSQYNEMLALFESEVVANLPRIPAKGGVKFDGAVIIED
jgi:hypothetical protein